MNTRRRQSTPLDSLRHLAEEVAQKRSLAVAEELSELTPEQTRRALHELRVFQIELETQNEELRRAHAELEITRARYFDLYDMAPVGYCTLGDKSEILEANLTAASMLGVARTRLVKQLLTRFILHADQDIYYRHRNRLQATGEAQSCDLRMVNHQGGPFWAHLESTVALDETGKPANRLVLSDISELKRAEESLRESAQHTQAILDNMVDGVITVTQSGLIESFNKAACSIFGYPSEEVIGQPISRLLPDPSLEWPGDYLQHTPAPGFAHLSGPPRDQVGLRKNGTSLPLSVSVYQISRADQPIFVGIVRDITQRRLDEEEIRRLAYYDPLTGLPNRRLLMDRLKRAVTTSSRTGQHGAVMFLDLDNFKQLNDSLGHDLGDVLLQQVASRLTSCAREGDSVARLGGDEFVVLLECLSVYAPEAASQAEAVAARLLEALRRPFILRENTHQNTPSIGIVIFTQEQETIDNLLKKADVAMYQAKSAGRNTARFFDPAMQAEVAAKATLEKDMRFGLNNDEFTLYYQIQVGLSGTPSGVEALVRWIHGKRGLVSPAQFIPLAEESGLILPLGHWVLETACQQLVAWSHHPQTAHWTMAVNVSVSQFSKADFVASVAAALIKTGADPSLLKLELTESMLVNNVEDVITKMNAIHAFGVGFSLDDFGTGFSSLQYLKRLPVQQLKIDQSFVRDVLTDPNDAAIARTIVNLGHSLGLTVIAEGVETLEQRNFLTELGCDAFQGYFFGHPEPAGALKGTVKR